MSMKLVKQLRQATGARLVDCKAAVEATTGLEEAFQWLREKGASRAAKLETRTAAHGLVAARAAAGRGCLVEVNSETDFVARNAEFQRFVRDLADAALRNYASLTAPQRDAGGAALVGGDALKALDLQGTLVTDAALALSAHVGERIDVRRCALVEGAAVSAYAHNGADGAGTAASSSHGPPLAGGDASAAGASQSAGCGGGSAQPLGNGTAVLDPSANGADLGEVITLVRRGASHPNCRSRCAEYQLATFNSSGKPQLEDLGGHLHALALGLGEAEVDAREGRLLQALE